MSDHPDDKGLLAGEYVLGVLEPAESYAVEAEAETNAALARAIDWWRARLAPLAFIATPVLPPAFVWPRIEATLGFAPSAVPSVGVAPSAPAAPSAAVVPTPPKASKPPGLLGRPGFWRFTTAASLALAAGIAGFAIFGRPPEPDYAAALAPFNSPAPAFLARWEPDGRLTVRPLAAVSVQPGRDLELWILPAGAKQPKSLGVLPPMGRRLTVDSGVPGAQLMVSLEPTGGSPTGAPTGPVLYVGTVAQLD